MNERQMNVKKEKTNMEEGKDEKIERLKNIIKIKKVDPYQPAYGLPRVVKRAQRDCIDRCKIIMGGLGDVNGSKILDIGSSLGYISFYFADKGAGRVEGWDRVDGNIEVSKLISEINGIEVTFKKQELNEESVSSIAKGDFDIVIMLSILHHINAEQGVNVTKKLMKNLFDVIPVLIVELPRKGENPGWVGDKLQPDNELEIFELIKDDISIRKLAEFRRFKSKTRPLYIISKIKVIFFQILYKL
jgi:O-antigen chain-terminating methyltransferase